MTFYIDIQYVNETRWYKTLVSMEEYVTLLGSGMLDSRLISKCILMTVEGTEDALMYDFVLAKTGQKPFVGIKFED